ncbi:MAG: two-component regulator propeller domain-containing protein [Bacteroidota bacterium]
MTINTLQLILILLLSSHLLACNVQVNTESKQAEIKSLAIGRPVSEIDQQIWEVYQDTKGNFWFGSNGNGIYYFDGKQLKQITADDGLVHNQIRGIQEDGQGNIYVETPKGISQFDGTNLTTLKVIQSANNTWKLEPDDLWFNCNGNANQVYRWDGENLYELQLPRKEIEETLGIKENEIAYSPFTVYGIDKDKRGNLWLGTVLAGAFRFDGQSFLWIGEKELSRLPDGREPGVRSILEDKNGYIWLSNFKSKYKIQADATQQYERQKAVDLSEDIVRDKILYFNSGIADQEGNLWMTTYGGGVWKYDGNTLSNLEINNGKEEVLLMCIYQDNKGTIWLGTYNDGVYKQNGDHFEKFEAKLGK